MLEEKLVLCLQSDSLNCFINRAKGRKCGHCLPHKYNESTCWQSKCISVNGEIIPECACVLITEEDTNGKKIACL